VIRLPADVTEHILNEAEIRIQDISSGKSKCVGGFPDDLDISMCKLQIGRFRFHLSGVG
jgi:hypothetical protein